MTLTSRCGVLLAAISLVGAAPSAADGGGPRGGPRKRVAVTDVDVKIGGVLSGTPVSVNVASPARRRGVAPGAPPAAAQTQPSADPWGNVQQQNAGQVAGPQQPSADPWSNPTQPAAPPTPAAPGNPSDPWASVTSSPPPPASPPPPTPTQGSTPGGAANSVGSAISNPTGAVAGVLGFGGSPKPQPVAAPAAGTSRTLTAQTPDAVPPPAAFGAGMTEMLTTALVKADRFIVLERKDLGAIRSEQALGTDPIANADLAAKAGKLLGAQALVRAVVTEYGTSSSASGVNSSYLRGVDLSRTSQSARVVVDVRIFDAETGQIMASERAEGSSSSTGLGVQVSRREGNLGSSTFGETPIGRAARDAIEKAVAFIVEKLENVPWRGRIAEVDPGPDGTPTALYVNAGAKIGLRKGDLLEVYSLGRQIVDPDTGTVIGQTGGIVGRCRLEEVNPDMSVAVPVSGVGFQKGAQVRFLADAR